MNTDGLRELEAKVVAQGLQESVEVVGARFEDIALHGDAIYFEFCFHEMDDPEKALIQAKSLAPEIVVYDHSAGSEWIYYGAEEDRVSSAPPSCGASAFGAIRRSIRNRNSVIMQNSWPR